MARRPDLSVFGLPVTLRVFADVDRGDSTFILPVGVRLVRVVSEKNDGDAFLEVEARLFIETEAVLNTMHDHDTKMTRTPDKLFGAQTVKVGEFSPNQMAAALEAAAQRLREDQQ